MAKKIAILGSTGSIGTNTLDVISKMPGAFEVVSLTVNTRIDLLEEQVKQFSPKVVCVCDEEAYHAFKARSPKCRVVSGVDGLIECATISSVDLVVGAISGIAGLVPVVKAIESGKDIGLANKEVLVSAGEYVSGLAQKQGVKLIPIDSEHTALFQCLQGRHPDTVKRLILTASGGPFRTYSQERLKSVTVAEALNHPSWEMGQKVTIDCSTMMNKGLEVIEAAYLYGVDHDRIDVIVHPQSLVHSMVEFIDGHLLAQVSAADMRLPIQYALTHPDMMPNVGDTFDFVKHSHFDFFPPDYEKFPALRLAFDSLKMGGSAPCYLNAVNEVLVSQFLAGDITWLEIGQTLERLLPAHRPQYNLNLDEILRIDSQARSDVLQCL